MGSDDDQPPGADDLKVPLAILGIILGAFILGLAVLVVSLLL